MRDVAMGALTAVVRTALACRHAKVICNMAPSANAPRQAATPTNQRSRRGPSRTLLRTLGVGVTAGGSAGSAPPTTPDLRS